MPKALTKFTVIEISHFSSSLVLSQSQWFTDIALSNFYSLPACLPNKESTGTAGTACPSAVSCLAVLQPSPERQLHPSGCFFPVLLLLSSGSLHPPSLPQPFHPSPPRCAFNRCIPPCVFLLSLWWYCSMHSNESGPLLKFCLLTSLNLNFVVQVHH